MFAPDSVPPTRCPDSVPGSNRRDCAVAVYVKKKVPADRLPAKDLVPDSLTISGRSGPIAVPTRVIEQGEVRPK